MDPYFLYSIGDAKNNNPCVEGSSFSKFFELFASVGNARELIPPGYGCGFDWLDYVGKIKEDYLDFFAASLAFKIDNYGPIDISDPNAIRDIKFFSHHPLLSLALESTTISDLKYLEARSISMEFGNTKEMTTAKKKVMPCALSVMIIPKLAERFMSKIAGVKISD